MWFKDISIDGINYRIKKADDKKHKYVSWHVSKIDGKHLLLSSPVKWGAFGMSHYFDKFEQYSNQNHNDEQRLKNFRSRFGKLYEKNKNNPKSAIFWSWRFLW
jgi:hypothetical protein